MGLCLNICAWTRSDWGPPELMCSTARLDFGGTTQSSAHNQNHPSESSSPRQKRKKSWIGGSVSPTNGCAPSSCSHGGPGTPKGKWLIHSIQCNQSMSQIDALVLMFLETGGPNKSREPQQPQHSLNAPSNNKPILNHGK